MRGIPNKDNYRGRYIHKAKRMEKDKQASGVHIWCSEFPEKRQSRSEARAQVLVDILLRFQPNEYIHAYYCNACDYWHVGRLQNRPPDTDTAAPTETESEEDQP